MKKIPLTQGKFALVDDDDYEWLNQWKWCVQKSPKTSYATRGINRGKGKSNLVIIMHRLIMDAPKGKDVDHINHNGLDNQRCNLRICTRSQNQYNQRSVRKGTSRYKGVNWNKLYKKWYCVIGGNKNRKHIGVFDDEIKAAKAYDKAALKRDKTFSCLNFPDEVKNVDK